MKFWKSQWGGQIWFSFGSNQSAGVAILQGKFKGTVLRQMADTEGRWIMLLTETDQSQFLIINTYGYNNKQHNKQLFLVLEEKIEQILLSFPTAKTPWGGDFNTVMNDNLDRWPPRNHMSTELHYICDRLGIIDIWRSRHVNKTSYTWTNKDRTQQSRMDF